MWMQRVVSCCKLVSNKSMAAKMWLTGLLLLLLSTASQAFLSSSMLQVSVQIHEQSKRTALNGGLFGLGKNENEEPSGSKSDLSVPTKVLEIPVASLKRGGLRFALGLLLVGYDKETWKLNQTSDSVLDMYFQDNSAMFSLVLENDGISVDRYGKPSLAYVLQESLVLHSLLDELDSLAFGVEDDIKLENRLLQLEEPGDAIEKARATLPARKA